MNGFHERIQKKKIDVYKIQRWKSMWILDYVYDVQTHTLGQPKKITSLYPLKQLKPRLW